MDMIYADRTGKDLGVLTEYTMDMAYGSDENDFEIVIPRKKHCCMDGYIIYSEGTEYGGIIDTISADTESGTVTYYGRTWHGVLNSTVLCPDEQQDYLVLDGEANTVLMEILYRLNLVSVFSVASEDSGIDISDYSMERYVKGYDGICKMLSDNNAKIGMEWKDGRVELSALPVMDYSQDMEFNDSQMSMKVKRNYRPVNHIVCLGSGDLADRAVIHIFTDENGGVQPYTTTDVPLEDSDYITDQRNKILTGCDEVSEVIDYPNSDATYNYIPTTQKPSGWEKKCDSYFLQEDEKYKNVEYEKQDVYTVLKKQPYDWDVDYTNYYVEDGGIFTRVRSTTNYDKQTKKPSDWKKNYKNYYEKKDGSYVRVQGVEHEKYKEQARRPKDWSKNYSKYFYTYSDGIVTEKRNVSGISKHRYKMQTRKPTDWDVDYTNYYRRKSTGGFERVPEKEKSVPSWKKRTYYTRISYSVAPKWNECKRFTYSRSVSAPEWGGGTYYTRVDSDAPIFEKGKYYSKSETETAPEWVPDTYYSQVEDRYAELVRHGIERLEELWSMDETELSLKDTDRVYDIGDYVGAYEHVTELDTVQVIMKKIIRIEKGIVSIRYESK